MLLKKKGIILIALLSMVAVWGCGKDASVSPEELAKVSGTWVKVSGDMTTTYTINSDGTYMEEVYTSGDFPVSMDSSGTYTYDGEKITFTEGDSDYSYSFGVSFDGNDMIFDNEGNQTRYTKK